MFHLSRPRYYDGALIGPGPDRGVTGESCSRALQSKPYMPTSRISMSLNLYLHIPTPEPPAKPEAHEPLNPAHVHPYL